MLLSTTRLHYDYCTVEPRFDDMPREHYDCIFKPGYRYNRIIIIIHFIHHLLKIYAMVLHHYMLKIK